MKKIFLFFAALTACCLLSIAFSFSQGVAINSTGAAADNSAILDVSSTVHGVLISRMSDTERDAIPSPATGLLIFNTSTNVFNFYKSTGWYELAGAFVSASTGILNPGVGTAINSTGVAADKSAMLDVSSNLQGMLIPRTSPAAISSPATGLIIFDISTNNLKYFNGSVWKIICENLITVTTGSGSLAGIGVAINNTNNPPDPSSMLDISSADKGMLIPRMASTERNQLLPKTGLVIYNTTANTIDFFNGVSWYSLATDVGAAGTIIGAANVCPGQNGVAYSVGGIANATSYNWSYSGTGFTIASGSGTNSITADFSASATSGILTVYGTNACGNGAVSADYPITVNSIPTAPTANAATNITTISFSANWAASTGATTYYLDVSTINTFASFVTGYNNLDVGAVLTYSVTGLTCNTTYYYRIRAGNTCGVSSNSNTITVTTGACGFSCGSPFTDARDGQSYTTVLIGSQCWMSQNLNYGTYWTPFSPQTSGIKFCQNMSGVSDPTCPYGGLYEWSNMMQWANGCNGTGAPPNDRCSPVVKGLCPTGWHIPSHYEWTTMEKNVGSSPGSFPYDITTTGYLGFDEGYNIKATSIWSPPGTNSSGFTAYPAGYSWGGALSGAGTSAFFWSSTWDAYPSAWSRRMYSVPPNEGKILRNKDDRAYGMSVRCVKD